MWLKKILGKPSPPPVAYPLKVGQQEKENFENESEEAESTSPLIDNTPDFRYQHFKELEGAINIKIPMTLLHPTEVILLQELNFFTLKPSFAEQSLQIDILATDRQLVITPNPFSQLSKSSNNYLVIPYGHLQKAELISNKGKKQPSQLLLQFKDAREVMLKSVLGDLVLRLHEVIKSFAFVTGVNRFYAFRYGKQAWEKEQEFSGWKTYNIKKQFGRQGLSIGQENQCMYQYINNKNGQLSPTYPEYFVVPTKMGMQNLKKCAYFRTKQRLPVLTYALQYKQNCFSTLFRCSQNKVGMLNARSKEDEMMMGLIGNPGDQEENQGKKNCKIYDARGYYAALGNMLAGKGYEKEQNYKNCQIEWLNIPNIHAVRDSFHKMFDNQDRNNSFFTKITESGWYDCIFLILSGAKSIAQDLLSGLHVVVHCSDGWDRTSQLCALAQVLIDPYFRTIEGLMVIVEKDWRHFGHKFRERTGQYHPTSYHLHEKSPIFIQFLDCLYQLMHQFPLSFEYNDRLILFLAENLDSHIYGTFLTNNIQESKKLQIEQETISIWSAVKENQQIYLNPFYKGNVLQEGWLKVATEAKHLRIWKEYFFGESISENTSYYMMRQAKQVNKTMRKQYYQNQELIEQLKLELKQLSK